MKNNGSALHGGVMVRLGCGLLALVMLLGLLFAGGAFAYADNTEEVNALSAVDTANGFYVEVKGRSVPQGAALVLKPVSDDVLNYARNGRTLSEDEFFLMYDLCFKDYLGNELEVTPDGYRITVYFTAPGECFSSIDVAAVGGTLGELETKAANKLAEEAAEAEKAAAEEAVSAPAETTAPAEETTAPVEETTAPVAETTAPVAEETTAPAEETTAPVAETTAPVAETTAPVAETTAPVAETAAPVEEAPVADRNLKTSEVHIADLYNGNHYVTFNTDGLGILKFTGTSYNVNDITAEETAEPATLYDRLMACETMDEVNAILDNLTEEEAAEMEAFTEEQNAALTEKMDALGAYGVEELAYRYTIAQGGRQKVTVDKSIERGSLKYEVAPSTSASTSGSNKEISVQMDNGGSSYTVSVGRNVPVGDYTVTVTYTTTTGSWPNQKTETHTETFIVHVVESQTGSSSDYYSQDYYADPAPEHVAWDVVGEYRNQKPNKGADNADSFVESVQINAKDVEYGDSDRYYRYSASDENKNNHRHNPTEKNPTRVGQTLDNYFGSNVTKESPSTDAVLTITPRPGYYVTGYWIVCTNGATAYNCAVLGAGNEHHATFKFADTNGGAVQDTVWSEYFGHPDACDDQYFILVSVAPVPTPLFVEYNYGIIKDEVADSDKSIFTNPTSWTSTAFGNEYGTGMVDTKNIQYRYVYNAGKPSEATNWKHFANSVTSDAKRAAADAGYYFAGWKAEYYTTASEQKINNNSDGRNYKYNFSSKYGSELSYKENEEVTLLMHCKLIAQWKPIELEVKKTVSGLTDDFLVDHTYTIQVQKLVDDGTTWDNYGDVLSITVNGNDSNSVKLLGITPGTYRAVEAEGSRGDLTNGEKTMYVTVTDSDVAIYNTANIVTSHTLEVKNDYTATAPTAQITVKKLISSDSNMLSYNDVFHFTVTGTAKDIEGNMVTQFNLKHGETITLTVNVGNEITITEASGDYNTKYQIGTGSEQTGSAAVISSVSCNETITFTNSKFVSIDTGVSLDSLPYILILGVVVVGAVVIVVSRSKHRRDY